MKINCKICNNYESTSIVGMTSHVKKYHADKLSHIHDYIKYTYNELDKQYNYKFMCNICGFKSNKHFSLTRHINTHNKPKTNNKIKCKLCNKSIAFNFLSKHLVTDHNISDKELFIAIGAHRMDNYDLGIILHTLLWNAGYTNSDIRYDYGFKSHLKWYSFREFEEADIEHYVNTVLPYRKNNPNTVNSIELAKIMSRYDTDYELIYQQMLEKNPYYNHDGRISPWSKDFIGYKELSESEKEIAIAASTQQHRDDRNINQYKYWMNKGYPESDAKKKVKEVQAVGKLDRFIKRYGEKEGTKRWKLRQLKWQNTLKSKPIAEQMRIAIAKTGNGRGWSNVSQKLFWSIYDKLPDQYKDECKFATNNKGVNDTTNNHEYAVCTNNGFRLLDFYIPSLKICIEFDGDYWHGSVGNKERDRIREEEISRSIIDLNLLRIKECDFVNNPDAEVDKCIEYILDIHNNSISELNEN